MNRKEAIQFWILGSRLHNTAVLTNLLSSFHLYQVLFVPLRVLCTNSYLKDDEKIFASSTPRQLDQIWQIAPCRGGFILDAQRTQEVGEFTEAGGCARKEEDVGIRCATVRAAAARTPAFQIVWSC